MPRNATVRVNRRDELEQKREPRRLATRQTPTNYSPTFANCVRDNPDSEFGILVRASSATHRRCETRLLAAQNRPLDDAHDKSHSSRGRQVQADAGRDRTDGYPFHRANLKIGASVVRVNRRFLLATG
jgi:hypothetical protein